MPIRGLLHRGTEVLVEGKTVSTHKFGTAGGTGEGRRGTLKRTQSCEANFDAGNLRFFGCVSRVSWDIRMFLDSYVPLGDTYVLSPVLRKPPAVLWTLREVIITIP